ncbi:MAG: N-acetylmuramoyl-L-alanine amidase [Geminicoccaceae bacterium]
MNLRHVAGWLAVVLLLTAGMLTGGMMTVAAEGTVRDITLLPHDDGVRIVIDMGRKVPLRQTAKDHPPRLVVDLPDISWQIPERRGLRGYRMIRGFRFGQLQQGISRVVFDVDRPFEIVKTFELPPNDTSGHRVVIDVLPLPAGLVMQTVPESTIIGAVQSPPRPAPKPRPRIEQRSAEQGTDAGSQQAALRNQGIARRFPPVPAPKPRFNIAKRLIVIDAGHGGIDPGASGRGGTYEKNVVLAMALELRRQLVDSGRYDVILTRDDDSFIRLRDRLQIARASEGHLFLSLHADSLANADEVHGAAVYTLSNQASSEEAARLASAENRADILGGIDLSHHEQVVTQILIDLAQRDANRKSLRVADLLVDELAEVTKMLRKEQQQAGFVVLKSPDMPSALIELGYLSNPADEKRLTDPYHLDDLAGAIIEAIDRYFGANPS